MSEPPLSSGAALDEERAWSFLQHEHSYLADFIRFADQKAALLFAMAGGILGLLYKQFAAGLNVGAWHWLRTHRVVTIAVVLTVTCLAASLWALIPRLPVSKRRAALVFWENVAAFGNAGAYHHAIDRAGRDGLRRELADHCYTLASICNRKYTALLWATWCGVAGALFALYTLFDSALNGLPSV